VANDIFCAESLINNRS